VQQQEPSPLQLVQRRQQVLAQQPSWEVLHEQNNQGKDRSCNHHIAMLMSLACDNHHTSER